MSGEPVEWESPTLEDLPKIREAMTSPEQAERLWRRVSRLVKEKSDAEARCKMLSDEVTELGAQNDVLAAVGVRWMARVEAAEAALVEIAELEWDCENQSFKLTRFQAAQIARRAIVDAARGAGV